MIALTATILQAIYERTYDQLIKIGRLYQIPETEIEDIINQTFLDFAEKKVDFSTIANQDAYVNTCFKRKLIDFYRRKKTSKINSTIDFAQLEFEDSELMSLEEKEIHAQRIEELYELFKTIPPRCQRVIFLKYYRRLSNEKIASETGLSVQTIYNNLSEGIKKLKTGFENKSKSPQLKNALRKMHSTTFIIVAIIASLL